MIDEDVEEFVLRCHALEDCISSSTHFEPSPRVHVSVYISLIALEIKKTERPEESLKQVIESLNLAFQELR